MIKIFVLSDDFEKWIEIKKFIGESCRGKVVDVIVLDKWVERDKERILKSMLGHRNSIIRTEKYYENEMKISNEKQKEK